MKRVLITGKNSYIGTSVESWLSSEYIIDTVDMMDICWKKKDFSQYDVVFHVAGIAHIKETKKNRSLYFEVNRDLAYDTAMKAKKEGVKQFVFLSSMSVYGIIKGVIDRNTLVNPNSAYGESKYEAEKLLKQLEDESFVVAIIRPPMVYGKGCKGNYSKLAALALKTPIFPNINNKRSMIYIDNLSEFVKQLIDNSSGGVFLPQNADYVNTSEMVKLIAEAHGKRVKMTKCLNPLLRFLNISIVNKVFGDLVYEKSISWNIDFISFKDSITRSEKV